MCIRDIYRTDHYKAFRKASEDFPISRAEAGLLKGLANAPYRLMVRFNNRGKLRAGFRVMRAVQRDVYKRQVPGIGYFSRYGRITSPRKEVKSNALRC